MSRIQKKNQTDPVFKTRGGGGIFGSHSAFQFPAGTFWIFVIFDKRNHFPCHFANHFATLKMNFGLCVLSPLFFLSLLVAFLSFLAISLQ